MTPRRIYIITAIGLIMIGVFAYYFSSEGVDLSQLPAHEVSRGEFLVTLVESGEIRASESETIVAPAVWGRMQIVHLWPEGAYVDVGDLVLQFDGAELSRELRDASSQLQKAKSDYEKANAELDQKLFEMEIAIEQSMATLELSRLNLKRAELGSPIELQEAQIEVARSERRLVEAKGNLRAEKIAAEVDLQSKLFDLKRRQKNYDRYGRDYGRLNVYATRPGLVVYEKIHDEGTTRKVRVGDSVWRGLPLISLPDLSAFQVAIFVGEMDIKRIRVGQRAFVYLDAYPDLAYNGTVTRIFPMANPGILVPNLQVFEMVVDIDEADVLLRPGMSAAAEIILESVPDVVSVPLGAVFYPNGNPVAYRIDGNSFVPVGLQLGSRNLTSVIVESGLEAGATVALADPNSLTPSDD